MLKSVSRESNQGQEEPERQSKEENPAEASLGHSAQTFPMLTPILHHPTLAPLWLSVLERSLLKN